MAQRTDEHPGPALVVGEAVEDWTGDAVFYEYSTAADPLGCRLNPASGVFVRFFDNEAGQPFTRWADYIASTLRFGGVKQGGH